VDPDGTIQSPSKLVWPGMHAHAIPGRSWNVKLMIHGDQKVEVREVGEFLPSLQGTEG
jgi:hypothetical protein